MKLQPAFPSTRIRISGLPRIYLLLGLSAAAWAVMAGVVVAIASLARLLIG